MIEIKDLLLKFSNKLLSEEIKKEAIRNVISEVIQISIDKKDVKIKNGIIYLNIKPIYKNEILLKRDKIDFLLEKSLGERYPKDIR